jgi:hypothetical protein
MLFSFLLVCFLFIAAFAEKPTVNRAAVLDFDGDGKSDCAVVRYVSVTDPIPSFASRLRWFILRSSGGWIASDFGIDVSGPNQITDEFTPSDYDGDGKWDIAIWRRASQGSQSYFYIWQSATNSLRVVPWGLSFDYPWQVQDFDGDGKADPTITRGLADGLYWWMLLSRTNQVQVVKFGTQDDRPIRGDFDGDGKADIAVFRWFNVTEIPTFYILRSSDEQVEIRTVSSSVAGSVLPGDFDGDKITDIAFARIESNMGFWYWQNSSDSLWHTKQFGAYGSSVTDIPVPGDYDGDGKTDVAIWRKYFFRTQAYFWIDRSRDGLIVIPWGHSEQENNPNAILQFR